MTYTILHFTLFGLQILNFIWWDIWILKLANYVKWPIQKAVIPSDIVRYKFITEREKTEKK